MRSNTLEHLLTGDYPGVGSSDNYAYLVVDDKSKDAVIIDPAHPKEYARNFHYRIMILTGRK